MEKEGQKEKEKDLEKERKKDGLKEKMKVKIAPFSKKSDKGAKDFQKSNQSLISSPVTRFHSPPLDNSFLNRDSFKFENIHLSASEYISAMLCFREIMNEAIRSLPLRGYLLLSSILVLLLRSILFTSFIFKFPNNSF
jgi:hypothetical protein